MQQVAQGAILEVARIDFKQASSLVELLQVSSESL